MNLQEKIEEFINDQRIDLPKCRLAIGKAGDFWIVEFYETDRADYPKRTSKKIHLESAVESLILSMK